jgi:membrane protein insertase Oxa1/YidC/SpoIIIJ
MSFITLSIADWPIIKELAFLMGGVMRGIYLVLSSFEINSIIACLVFFVIISKLLMLPLSIDAQRGVYIKKYSQPEIKILKERYDNTPNIYIKKRKLEENLITSKYYGSRFNAGATFFIRFAILVAVYGVVIGLEKHIPELTDADAATVNNLYTFLSLDLRLSPNKVFSYSLLIPLFVYATSFLEAVFGNVSNQTPAFSIATFVSPLVVTFFAFTLPMFVGVYWGLGSLINVIINFFIMLYYKRKPKEYFINLALKYLNKKRAKRGLPSLKEPPVIPFASNS